MGWAYGTRRREGGANIVWGESHKGKRPLVGPGLIWAENILDTYVVCHWQCCRSKLETRTVKSSPLNCERIFHWYIFMTAIGSRRNVFVLSIETVLVLSFRGTDKLKEKKIWRAATHGLQVINWPGSPPLHVPTPSSSSANVFFPFLCLFFLFCT